MKADTAAAARVAIDRIVADVNRGDQPGYVIGVAKDGHILYRRGLGLASIEHTVANTPATRMRIGSTTKHFTSLSLMLLAEDGKLDPDVRLRNYLPELTGPIGDPTLRQLMNHTGGICDALEITALFLTEGLYPKLSIETIYRWSQRFQRMNFRPGERGSYSNLGYNLLSLVIERVSGRSLADFMKERIFVPLGMLETALVPDDLDVVPRLATFHVATPDGRYRRGIYPCELLGGGGIVSTVDDMLRWMAHLRKPTIVGSPATWAQFRHKPRFNNGAESNYCMGLIRQPNRGPELVYHSGGTFGATCQMLTIPEHALDIIIMSNRSDSDPVQMSAQIAEAILGGALGAKPSPVPSAGREWLLGRYYSPASRQLLEISARQDQLALSICANLAGFLVEHEGDLVNYALFGPVRLKLGSQTATRRCERIELDDCGVREIFERLPESAPTPQELASDLVGQYTFSDFGTVVEVVIEGNSLYIDLCSRYATARLELQPLSDQVLTFTASFIGQSASGVVVLEKDGTGRTTGFFLGTPRTWNLHFSRVLSGSRRLRFSEAVPSLAANSCHPGAYKESPRNPVSEPPVCSRTGSPAKSA